MSSSDVIKEHYTKIGRKGGLALKKKYGSDHFRKMGLASTAKRWGKKINKEEEDATSKESQQVVS